MPRPIEHDIDEIDRTVLKILAKDPRTPYSDIANELAEEGYEMSGEGVRNRVAKLLQKTSPFFLLEPEEHSWEIVRIAITVSNDPGTKDEALERVAEMPFWLVCRGVGSFDVYAVATAVSNKEVDALVQGVKELDGVVDVEFSIETDRDTNVDDYLTPELSK